MGLEVSAVMGWSGQWQSLKHQKHERYERISGRRSPVCAGELLLRRLQNDVAFLEALKRERRFAAKVRSFGLALGVECPWA